MVTPLEAHIRYGPEIESYMVRSDGKQAPPRRRRTRSVPEAEATPGPMAENDRRESRESRKKSARKERKRCTPS